MNDSKNDESAQDLRELDAQINSMAKVSSMAEKLMIIDTDCGIDDAQAIMLALASPNVKILGITCCFGNTDVDNVCENVLRVLTVCQRTQIPVFRGSDASLVGSLKPFKDHFGTDGLGDVLEGRNSDIWKKQIQKEHAVNAIIRLINENQGQVSLVALGPLTNLALAVRLDPSIHEKLKELYIMGGNMEGKGNVMPCAEFNFFMDPESAYIVLEEYLCPTHIASWEFTCRHKLSWVRMREAVTNFIDIIVCLPQFGAFLDLILGLGDMTSKHYE